MMKEMMSEQDVSDNCASQYKSGLAFHLLQQIGKMYHKPVIHIYGIPGHEKGELDHVGGTTKVTAQ